MSKPIEELRKAKERNFIAYLQGVLDYNKNNLVIIADPETDVIAIAHKGKIASAVILDGKKKIVQGALKYSRYKGYKKNGKKVNPNYYIDNLLSVIDGALYNIAKSIADDKNSPQSIKGHKNVKLNKRPLLDRIISIPHGLKRQWQRQKHNLRTS